MLEDRDAIRNLNEAYIRAFLDSDPEWYEAHLAEDFRFIDGAGTLIDRQAFLRLAAAGSGVLDYQLQEVAIRIYGDAALVQAVGVFQRTNGTHGRNRYTDVYVRQNDEWKAVSAQVTPVANSELHTEPSKGHPRETSAMELSEA